MRLSPLSLVGLAPLALVALTACKGDGGGGLTDDTGPAVVDGPTWYADIQPLVAKNCQSCHADGGIGGRDLTTYEGVAAVSELAALWTAEDIMPLPAADPACRDYHGSESMVLTAEEKALFAAWHDGGAPEGDPATAPEPVDWTVSLEGADLRFELPMEHTFSDQGGSNEYYCYVVDNPLTEPTWITGFDVDLDNRSLVHHIVLAIDYGHDAGLDYGDSDSSDGFACADPIVEDDWLLLHAWTPGQPPVQLPEGHGMLVQPDDQIVMQMHYFDTSGEPQTDRSAYIMTTAEEVEVPVEMAAFGPTRFTIPAGDAAYTRDYGERNDYGGDFTILGMFPHMHWLGAGYAASIEHDDGTSTCLVQDDQYSFDHQATYIFKEPATWAQGEKMNLSCTWDNSASNPYQYNSPPKDVSYGEGTNEEMCFFLFYYAVK